MKTRFAVAVLAAALLAPAASSAYRLTESWSRSFEVDEGAFLHLANRNGSIEIAGWDRPVIEVEAEIRIKSPDREGAEELFRMIEFDVDADRGRVSIEADLPRVRRGGLLGLFGGDSDDISIRYRVRVPVRTDLKIVSVNGDIESRETRGSFTLKTTNGSISLSCLGGEGSIESVNGRIECEMEDLAGDGDLRIRTVNGGVELRIPEKRGGRLDAKTVNGGIDLDLPLERTIRIKRSSIQGYLGGGEGEVRIRTVNGGIEIGPI